MDRLNLISKLIEENADFVNFSEYGNWISDELIIKAELDLNIKFPKTYIWWLKHFRGGEIYGDEIFSIYKDSNDGIPSGDIVYRNLLDRKNNILSEDQLAIMTNDMGETFFFDLQQTDDGGEFPVYRLSDGSRYADDFLDFLIRQISDEYY
ncbi:SMI1/KNR4 family protein [Pedobacter fastidiosus]|uniref:SMI1/KNR4 family protein n=1 Tax=Pedobacter fastidiosus TaxID=2765361 RepID=A0ABR7KRN4_9SPHI|nr:SMI1/KNR4 family protein [Pedobacter fastidiosus]MBC6110686.1 SMI1/KNR4 family protein [Pedobacter fastidiosus]